MAPKIDKSLTKWVSRKLLVFAVACGGLFSGKLDSQDWVIIATAYIAAQGATDVVERLMKLKSIVPKVEEPTEQG